VTNYNEDGQDSFEEEEDDMTPSYWANAAEDTGPIIDKILDHRPKDESGTGARCDDFASLIVCRV
jgi:chromodomain-helicase-DNA-binding protein 1